MTATRSTRVGIYIDGSYFGIVSDYYNYTHARRSRISLQGLERFVRSYLAYHYVVAKFDVHVVGTHFFRGRFGADEAAQNDKLYGDRVFDEVLMRAGVDQHYLPIGSHGTEKGIDVLLALTAYEHASQGEVDMVVLITGDSDFVPLARKLRAKGVRTMLCAWDVNLSDDGQREVRSSSMLFNSVDFGVQMDEIIDSPTEHGISQPVIDGLFVSASEGDRSDSEGDRSKSKERTTGPHRTEPDYSAVGEARTGSVKRLVFHEDSPGGYGFIDQDSEVSDIWFYHSQALDTSFESLKEGDRVAFNVSANSQGLCANDVRRESKDRW